MLSDSSDDDLPDVFFGESTVSHRSTSSLPSSSIRQIHHQPRSDFKQLSPFASSSHHSHTSPISISSGSSSIQSSQINLDEEPLVVTDNKMSAKQERMERRRKEALEKRKASEARKLEREQKRVEKQQQNKLSKALKKAASESSKENGNAELMAELASEMNEAGIEYRVNSEMYPGSVRWRRKVTERSVNENAEVIKTVNEEEENELLVTLEAQGFFGLVHYTKQAQIGNPLPVGSSTLQQFVEGIQQDNPGCRLSLAVEGVDAFIRGNKTRFNRQFRQAVINSGDSSSTSRGMFSDVSRVDCEEALVDLQLCTGCMVRMCVNGVQLAEHIITLTKALSEAHYKRETPFSFHLDPGQGATKKALSEAGSNKVSLIWKHQLMQFNNLSDHMAAAIVSNYSSPSHLLSAYNTCSDRKEAELLLQDIMVRRGVGVVASSRRLGPALSKRIYLMMTSRDKDALLT